MLTNAYISVNNILWPNKCVCNNPSALNSMILLYSVVYMFFPPILSLFKKLISFDKKRTDALLINPSVAHNSPEISFTAAEAHQLKIWVKLHKIVV